MIDQELKKKIINTISRYELKCDKMQLQINALKAAINQLITIPISLDYHMPELFTQFQSQLDVEIDPKLVEKKVNRLVEKLAKEQKKKSESSRIVHSLVKQGADSIARLASKSYDKKAVTKFQKMLDTEVDNQAILVHFNEVLNQCIGSVVKDLDEYMQVNKDTNGKNQSHEEINVKINDSLHQLLNHLSIPQDLNEQKESIKENLEQKLSNEDLSKILNKLTDLVIDAFNLEQNRFKGFLQQLTNQLQDFDHYLNESSIMHKQSSSDSRALESGIQNNIDQIKSHLDNSTTIEELSSKISNNLNIIGDRIREYRQSEDQREKEYETRLVKLQIKLSESEQHAEEIKNLISFQKYKINHDSLTGLPNRESYNEYILDSFERWRRTEKVLSLAVGDIDHFKRINDNFGHLAGDKVLKKVATIFKSALRSSDFIARIGGEEFVFVFEHTSGEDAYKLLNKLRQLIDECQFFYREIKVDVSISFGLAIIQDGDDIESLFMRADNAMYKAKKAGRNRVEKL